MSDAVGLLLLALVLLSCLALWSMAALVGALVCCAAGVALWIIKGMKW